MRARGLRAPRAAAVDGTDAVARLGWRLATQQPPRICWVGDTSCIIDYDMSSTVIAGELLKVSPKVQL